MSVTLLAVARDLLRHLPLLEVLHAHVAHPGAGGPPGAALPVILVLADHHAVADEGRFADRGRAGREPPVGPVSQLLLVLAPHLGAVGRRLSPPVAAGRAGEGRRRLHRIAQLAALLADDRLVARGTAHRAAGGGEQRAHEDRSHGVMVARSRHAIEWRRVSERVRAALLVWAVAASCARPAPPTSPQPPVRRAVQPVDWPVPVRVLVRTAAGEIVVHGTLPPARGHTTALPGGDRWFVEPIDLGLDDRALAALVDEVNRHRVPGLSLRGARSLGDRAAGRLAGLRGLVLLDLTGTKVSGAGIARLDALRSLRGLYLAGTRIADGDLAGIAARHPDLEVIDLEGCAVGDPGVAALAVLPLRQLSFASTGITDKGAAALRVHAARLTSIDLGETNVGDAGLAWLADASNLVQLGLWRTQVSNRLLPLLEDARRLTSLDLSETAVDDAGMKILADTGVLGRLTSLDLSTTRVSDRGAMHLPRADLLESLDLGGTRVEDLRPLGGLHHLRFLSLRKLAVDEDDVRHLAGLTALRHLDLGETRVSSDVVPHLDPMTELAELYLDTTSIEDDAVVALAAHHPHLRLLHLDDNGLGDRSARALATLTELTELTVGETELGEQEITALAAAIPHVEVLDVSSLGLTDAIAPTLARLPRLHTLDLSRNDITDRGLEALRPLRLQVLGLQHTRVTRSRTAILAAFPNLRDLVTDPPASK